MLRRASFRPRPVTSRGAARERSRNHAHRFSGGTGEIAVELEVGGAIVAPHLNNDRLDIPLRNYVDLLLLDGEDLPMSGERYAVVLGGREVSSGRLDENGAARLVELPSVRCRITFPDLEPQTDLRRLSIEDVPEELR